MSEQGAEVMTRRPAVRSNAAKAALWGAVSTVLLLGGCAAWRLHESAGLLRQSEPLSRPLPQPSARLLIVGDSTAVGTGAGSPQASIAGLLAQAFPRLSIENRGRDGAKFNELLEQLDGVERFDMVLVMAGGNDVIQFRGLEALRDDIDRVTQRARQRADLVMLMPSGNVGNAPFFSVPFTWLMTWRSRQLHTFVREAASRHGATVVNLFHERDDDPFVRHPELNASDGLHPSDAGYRVWFDALLQQVALPRRLSEADRRAAPRSLADPATGTSPAVASGRG